MRVIVPLAAFVVIAVVAYLLLRPGPSAAVAQPAPAPAQSPGQSPGQSPVQAPEVALAPAPAARVLRVQTHPAQALTVLGSLAPEGGALMQVRLTSIGAGVERLELARHKTTIAKDAPQETLLQVERHEIVTPGGTTVRTLVPLAMLGVEVDGVFVGLADDLTEQGLTQWVQTAPGRLVATVVDDQARPVVRVTRQYGVVEGRYRVALEQQVENLSGADVRLRVLQLGPTDLPKGKATYGGDLRRMRKGVVPPAEVNPDRQRVVSPDFVTHADVVGSPVVAEGQWVFPDLTVWPVPEQPGASLAWVGMTNRYFGVVMHGVPDLTVSGPVEKGLGLVAGGGTVSRVVLARGGAKASEVVDSSVAALVVQSGARVVKAGERADYSVGVFAGPVSRRVLRADPVGEALGLRELELTTFGGPCAFCTFQPVAKFLRWFLSLLHDYVTFDWALAVVLLVVCVRTLLHPVTRWSQMSLNRFSKDMQKLAPKQKALQEKYGSDPAKLREELAKLMKEENVSYAGMLGCIPMLLQSPIWIALYAMIFFFFDLRHEAAFYGLFQTLSGGSWSFLADLAEPDRFMWSPTWSGFTVPLMGHVDSVNVLPILLGVVFYLQQKYLQPPSATTLSPEMEMQQKIMKVMIVVMFPVMMYNAPAALSLYFITNSALGILESRHIRKQFEAREALREEELKRNPHAAREKKGFMARLQERALAAQQRNEAIQDQIRRRGGR